MGSARNSTRSTRPGNVVDILTFDNPGNKGDRSYKVAPWFISTRGYGFHLDSTARSTFDMRDGAAGRYVVTNHFRSLAFQVVYGPALTDVLSRYTGLTGRPSLPPPFAFGPWISSDIWRDGGEVRYAVDKFRERGIPVSAFVFDSPWEISYNDFKFNIPAAGFHDTDPEKTQFGHPGTFEGTRVSRVSRPHRDDDLLPRERAEGDLLDDPVRQRILEQRGSARSELG